MNTLIPYSAKHPEKSANDAEIFKAFIKVFQSIGGNADEVNVYLMKKSIEENNIKAGELERATIKAFEDYRIFGKIKWSDILRHLRPDKYSDNIPILS